jgi:predicted nucleotidyltransferase component of viral defense system
MINQFLWQEILQEAERRGLPLNKKRAILREYLQIKLLCSLYRQKDCQKMSFIGGTSLRLLRGLDRFSEDLDFDDFGLAEDRVKAIFKKTADGFTKEGYQTEFDFRKTKIGGTARVRFTKLLSDLGISNNPQEKLMIKFDFTFQKKVETEVMLLSGYGMGERIVTNSLPVLLSQKFKALVLRRQTRGRDFYDLFWLLSRSVDPNLTVLKTIGIKSKTDFLLRFKEFYRREKKNLPFYRKQVRPFLIHEENQKYLDLLGEYLK